MGGGAGLLPNKSTQVPFRGRGEGTEEGFQRRTGKKPLVLHQLPIAHLQQPLQYKIDTAGGSK